MDLTSYSREAYGVVGLRVGFAAVLYLQDTANAVARGKFARLFDDIRDRLAANLLWGQDPDSLDWIPAAVAPRASDWIPKLGEDEPFEFCFHGGKSAADASDWSFASFGTPAWQGGHAYVRIVTPLADALAAAERARADVVKLADRLKPKHGWSGPAVTESNEAEFMQAFQPEVWKLLQKVPGLMTDDPVQNVDILTDKMLGGAWLDIVGDDLRPGLDVEAIRHEPRLKMDAFHGGVVLAAGESPCRSEDLNACGYAPYRTAARATSAIRLRSHRGLHFAGPDRMHAREMTAWLARFDGPA
jgi:hypothetical protein